MGKDAEYVNSSTADLGGGGPSGAVPTGPLGEGSSPPPGPGGATAGSETSRRGGLLRSLRVKRPRPATGLVASPRQPAPQPVPSQTASGRGIARLPRHWQLLVAAVVPCLVLAAIGWWLWPQQPAEGPPHIAAGTVEADLLSPDSVSRVAGTTVVAGAQSNRPHAPLTVSPSACAVAAGPTTQSVYGQAWTAFVSATYKDAGATGAYTVNQVIGVFPDSKNAKAAFSTLSKGLNACSSSTRTDQADRTAKWTYTAQPDAQVAVSWTAAQGGSANWACSHQARVSGTSLVQVSVCQAGDGRPAVSNLADKLARKVSG